ncbi:FMN-binding protein [Microbacterium esteraromaticum]|uniref:FMN-binding protein n=1 Tax=Microbacterium esteraromaticum TaxID=57043 RepID=A0A939DT84_9MICO|nr:FMN-binding protein [Microbacterium esteraromaticum]MBN8204450.1 FMN-binding protein [Microbacterium esteraromaticum]MBN8414604.1 FMN-binding protein [Microbacterium esteraromaticum]
MKTSPLLRIGYAALATISGLVLLFGYRTSHVVTTPAQALPASSSSSSSSVPSDTSTTASDGTDSSSEAGASSSSALRDGTYTGDAASTRYGPVQVQISVSGGSIASVDVIDYPDSNHRDQQINSRAIPLLVSETTASQSSSIDLVSGATYTSRGYVESLQSAIDQARA